MQNLELRCHSITFERPALFYDVNKTVVLLLVCTSGTMIQSLRWNDETNMLAALVDGKFIVWFYPNAIYTDKDLLPRTIFEKDPRYTFHLYFFLKELMPIDSTTIQRLAKML